MDEPNFSRLASHPYIEEGGDGGAVLLGTRCMECASIAFPPRDICDRCLCLDLESQPLPRSGILYAFTVTTLTPLDQQGPVILGYVDLPGDVRVFAQIDADPDTVTCDSTVSLRAAEPITAPSGERVRYFQFVPDADLAEGESCAGS